MAFEEAQRILAKIIDSNLGRVKPLRPLPQYNPIGNKNLIPDISTLPGSPQRSNVDAASYIFRHAAIGKGAAGPATGQTLDSAQEDEEPSIISKIFDTLAIPENLGLNAVKNVDQVLLGKESIGEGLSDTFHEFSTVPARLVDNMFYKTNIPGTNLDEKFFQKADEVADSANRTTGKDLLGTLFPGLPKKNQGGYPGSVGLGLAVDLVADPLNFVGVGAAAKVAELARAGSAAKKLEEVAAARGPIQHAFAKNAIPQLKPPVAEEVIGGKPRVTNIRGLEPRYDPRAPGLAGNKFRYDKLAAKAGIPQLPRVNLPGFGRKLAARHVPPAEDWLGTGYSVENIMKPGGNFHGTSARWQNRLKPGDIWGSSSDDNLYAKGIYTTKNFDLANTYTIKGAGTDPTVYSMRWRPKKPPKFIDMDANASQSVIRWAEKFADSLRNGPEHFTLNFEDGSLEHIDNTIAEAKRGGIPNSTLYKTVQYVLEHMSELGAERRTEILDGFTEHLINEGFDGIKHIGGSGPYAQKHEVNIFFDPDKLHVTEAVPTPPTHGTANLPPAGISSPILANPFDADTAKIIEDINAGRISGKPPKVSRATQAKIAGTGTRLQDALLASRGSVRSGKGFTSATAIDKVIDGIRLGELPREVEVNPVSDPILSRSLTTQADEFAKNLKRIQPNKQVQLYSQIFNNVKKFVPKVKGATKEENLARHKAMAMSALRTAEDHLINVGKNPSYWTGHQVRLSEVLADTAGIDQELVLREFGKKQIDSPVVQDAVNKALARRSMTTGTALREIGQTVAAQKNLIHNTMYSTRGEYAARKVVREALRHLESVKFTPEELSAVKDVLQKTINVDKLPSDLVLTEAGPLLTRAVASGKVDASVIAKELKAIHKSIPGGPLPNELDQISGKGVIPAIMMRLATWWGRPDVAKVETDVFARGIANARVNGTTMRRMQNQFSLEERKAAWAHATEKETAATSRIFGLGGNFRRHFEHIFGSSGLREELGSASAEMSVAAKSQLALHDINHELDRLGVGKYFKFTNKNLTRFGGKDYSQGADWLHSWEEANPPDPASFLYDVNLAMERVTNKYAFYDELGSRFGSRRQGTMIGGMKAEHSVPVARLDGWYFSGDIKNQIIATERSFQDPQWRTPNGLKNISKITRIWKIGMTKFNPIHHERNLIGDSWLMWMAGINDPRVFIKSARILHSQRSRYEGILNSIDASDPQSLDRAYQELGPLYSRYATEWSGTKRSDIISQVRNKGKTTNVTAEEYWQQAHKFDLLPNANISEDIFGETPFGKLAEFTPIKKSNDFMSKVSEVREHYVRMAHFTGQVEKNIKRGFSKPQAFEHAAREVRKWHPDGRDLTKWEKNIRLIIPFYSWLRKSTPLVIQGLAQRPAKVLAYGQIQTAISNAMGYDTTLEDPFPDDQLFPDWIRAVGMPVVGRASDTGLAGLVGNLATTGRNAYTGKPEGYAVENPSNPMVDFFSQYAGTGRPNDPLMGIGESLNPLIKVPIELMQGRKFTGQPISEDPSGYAGENIPFAAPASRIFNYGPFGPTAQAERDSTNFDKEALINWLTGLGLRGTGPYINSAEFDAKERAARFAKRRTYSNKSLGTK